MTNIEKCYLKIVEMAMEKYDSLSEFLVECLDVIDIEDDDTFCIIECDLIDSWYRRKGFSQEDYNCCVNRGYPDNWFAVSYRNENIMNS